MSEKYFIETLPIRISDFTDRQLQAEVAKRGFLTPNGKGNENGFLNKMLPNMLKYREYKKGHLREYLERTVKHTLNSAMQEKILDFLAESFDYCYFDQKEYFLESTINIRFDVKNANLYAELFSRLEDNGIKKSAYIRNLIAEYCRLPEHEKDRICFEQEFLALDEACAEGLVLQLKYNNQRYTLIAQALEFSFQSEHWHFIATDYTEYSKLYSIPLYKIQDVLLLKNKKYNMPDRYADEIHALIDSGRFADKESFCVGGRENG